MHLLYNFILASEERVAPQARGHDVRVKTIYRNRYNFINFSLARSTLRAFWAGGGYYPLRFSNTRSE